MFTTPQELQCLKNSGEILSEILSAIKKSILDGEREIYKLDDLAAKMLIELDARSFKGYKPDFADDAYEYNICASVNNEIVHGLPSKDKILKDGDIVSIDMAVEHNGWYADSAFTIGIGEISESNKNLIFTAEDCFNKALEICQVGNTLGDVGHIINGTAKARGLSIAHALSGHGIGKALHEDPYVKNFGLPNEGLIIEPGMSFCIEPMLIDGDHMISEYFEGKTDGWTLYTIDGGNSSHYEHTIAITENGPLVLTRH